MIINALIELYTRDLKKLKLEIESYKNESVIWDTAKDIPNSAGNLCLHLVGNLNAYIGGVIGNSGYKRNREAEFALKNISRTVLLKEIEDTITVINSSLSSISTSDLDKEYPLQVFKDKMTTGHFLIHLATHLSYHLGQINYHRRLLD